VCSSQFTRTSTKYTGIIIIIIIIIIVIRFLPPLFQFIFKNIYKDFQKQMFFQSILKKNYNLLLII
jgi:hypothetical protein